ncbi:MAG TPA: AAA family ATPase, partial [Acidimicrobiales bacterium]|nr:AAA family ATPase [Acidimicrobiales bacterium]
MGSHGSRGDRRRLLRGGAQTDAAADPNEFAPAGDTDAASKALRSLGQSGVIGVTTADVGAHRERMRQGKMRRLALILAPFAIWFVVRATVLHRGAFGFPHIPSSLTPYLPGFLLILVLCSVMVIPLLGAGRSPHILYRPNEIDVRFDDVRGAPVLVDEVIKTLNLFLAHQAFADHMGGTARRAILFEGPPGTGKTYMAKAMAAEAGVPFLFVSSSAFQSMFYGQTNRKIRSYFRELRKYARVEGGAIGFIEEIDAIGGARGGMGAGRHHDGVAGVVNELLIQLQSFDQPPKGVRLHGWLIDIVNAWLPTRRHLHKPPNPPA